MFNKKTIHEFDIGGKIVLLRADYNVPLDEHGLVASDYRITQSLPTIRALQEKGCKIVICSHLGRPEGTVVKKYSLKPVAKTLGKLLGQDVLFAADCLSPDIRPTVDMMQPGDVLLLENVRFYAGEEANDSGFAQQLIDATGAELLVQDGFGVVHRAHATTDAVARIIPAVAGLLLEKEVDTITEVMHNPKKPLMAIIGGAKIRDKIDILTSFIASADVVAVGGAMANTFLKAQGIAIGDSLYDKDELDVAVEIIERAREEAKKRKFIFYMPQDGIVAEAVDNRHTTRIVDWDAHVIAEVEAYPAKPKREAGMVKPHEKILDIGPVSGAFIAGAAQMVETVVWNGTMGVAELPAVHGPIGPFAHGTEMVIEGLVGRFGTRPFTLLGGGDTSAYVEERDIVAMFSHVSTGGGASLELMSGKELPGVTVLWDK